MGCHIISGVCNSKMHLFIPSMAVDLRNTSHWQAFDTKTKTKQVNSGRYRNRIDKEQPLSLDPLKKCKFLSPICGVAFVQYKPLSPRYKYGPDTWRLPPDRIDFSSSVSTPAFLLLLEKIAGKNKKLILSDRGSRGNPCSWAVFYPREMREKVDKAGMRIFPQGRSHWCCGQYFQGGTPMVYEEA